MKYVTRGMKEVFIVGLAVVAAIALMLPSFIPDFIPFIGFADEAFWTLILINTANYYGFNLASIYGDNKSRKVIRRVRKRPTSTTSRPHAVNPNRMVVHDDTGEAPLIEEK